MVEKKKATPSGATFNQVDNITKEKVLQVLIWSRGKVSRRLLSILSNTADREMRKAIEQLREDGHPICVEKDGNGYWLGTDEEYESTVLSDYKSRIASYQRKITAHRMNVMFRNQEQFSIGGNDE